MSNLLVSGLRSSIFVYLYRIYFMRYCDERSIPNLKVEPVRQTRKRAKSRAAEKEFPVDPLKVRQLTQKSLLRIG